MTVSTTSVRDQYTGTGANTELPTTFAFNDSSEVVVTSRVTATGVETVLTETTHYTVSGGSWDIGSVTPVDGATDFPSTVTWTLQRVTPVTQETDYVENDEFSAESHENALDKLTFITQEREDRLDRALVAPATDLTSLDLELPSSVDRASQFLAFDSDGEPIATAGVAPDEVVVSTYMETVLDDADAASARTTLDAQEDVITTRGDVIRGSSAGVAERLALGAAGTVYSSDGTDVSFQTLETLLSYVPLPRGYIAGLTLSNDTDADHDILIAVGSCRDSTNAANLVLSAAMTKQLDAAWAVGDDAGGLFSGAAAAATVYHVFLIQKDSDGSIDAGFDTSLTAANIPTGYTKYRRIGSRRTQAAAASWRPMIQFGDRNYYDDAATALDISDAADHSGGTTVAIDVPTGIRVVALLRVLIDSNASEHYEIIECPDIVDEVPATAAKPLCTVATAINGATQSSDVDVLTNTSGQIRYRSSNANVNFYALTKGWIDERGRND